MGITGSIYTRLATDTELTALLSSYNGNNPAIFTGDRVPTGAVKPYIFISGNITAENFETKSSQGREIIRNIRCYAEGGESSALIETIAERVHTLLHRFALVITGFDNAMITEASPPELAPPEDDVVGRIVTLRLIAMES